MSNLSYKRVDLEEAREAGVRQERPMPFLVVDNRDRFGDSGTSRVSEIMDHVLARGSMPA